MAGCSTNSNSYLLNSVEINHSNDNFKLQSSIDYAVFVCFMVDTALKPPNNEYITSFKNNLNSHALLNLEVKNFRWSDEISFDVIQLSDIDNLSVTKTANESIKNAMTSWISGKVINASSVDLSILYHSDKYLSFVNKFEYHVGRVDSINDYITIDLESGKRVMLNDLVEINKEFVNFVQKSNVARDMGRNIFFENQDEIVCQLLIQIDPDDLLKSLEECSLTQEQIIQGGYYTIDESIGVLLCRSSFYLKSNSIVIVLQYGGELHVTLCLDDIVNFLRVEQWN